MGPCLGSEAIKVWKGLLIAEELSRVKLDLVFECGVDVSSDVTSRVLYQWSHIHYLLLDFSKSAKPPMYTVISKAFQSISTLLTQTLGISLFIPIQDLQHSLLPLTSSCPQLQQSLWRPQSQFEFSILSYIQFIA